MKYMVTKKILDPGRPGPPWALPGCVCVYIKIVRGGRIFFKIWKIHVMNILMQNFHSLIIALILSEIIIVVSF